MKLPVRQKQAFIKDLDLGMSMSGACRKYGISRTLGYRIQSRYIKEGFKGLEGRPPVPKTFPTKIKREVEDLIEKAVLNNPDKGPAWISKYLNDEKMNTVSPPTVQRILKGRNLETREKRLKRLFEIYNESGKENLSDSTIKGMEKLSPHFAYLEFFTKKPGELVFMFEETGYLQESRKKINFYNFLDCCGNTAFIIIDHREFWPRSKRNYYQANLPLPDIQIFDRHWYTDIIFAMKTVIYGKLDIQLKTVVITYRDKISASGLSILQQQVKPLGIEVKQCPAEQFFNFPYVKDFKKLFRREFKKRVLSKIIYDRRKPYSHISLIEESVNEFLDKYNRKWKIHTFPHLGKSPMDYICHLKNPLITIPMAVGLHRILKINDKSQ